MQRNIIAGLRGLSQIVNMEIEGIDPPYMRKWQCADKMTVDSDSRLKHNWQMNGIVKSIRRHLHHRGSVGGTAQKPVVAGTISRGQK